MKLALRVFLLLIAMGNAFPLRAQEEKVEITGTVMDDDGYPALSIIIRDTDEKGEVYGITDLDGNFTIKASPNTTLHFSGLTYAPKVVKLNGKKRINVVISFDSQLLNEVVIVAKRVVSKLTPEPTDIEIVGNQYILRPKVKIPKEMFKPDCRVVVQPMLVNQTRKTQRLFRPAVVTGKKYAITLERMMEFDLTRDPLNKYYEDTKRVDGNEVVAYVDSLYMDNPDDECRCDIYMYLVNYRKVTYGDTIVIARGTVDPMRFFTYNITPQKITEEKLAPRPIKQMRGDKGQVNLTFAVNSAKIDDKDPNNALELEKMYDRLSFIDKDPNSEFMAFSITAISSPEGTYQRNLELARMRAGTAKETIMKSLQPATVTAMRDSITVNARVEAWERVAELMEQDSVSSTAVRGAIEQYPKDVTMQYRKIAELPNYRSVIVPQFLPKLRRVEYSFSYSTLRFLNDQEIRQLYKENYKQLTEYEFWRLYADAETDADREKISRQALEVYPKFMLMANELAVILIKKKTPDAELLKPFMNDSTPQPILHNQVIALLSQMDYARADSVASLLKDSPMTADVKAITGAYNGDYETAYERFGPKGGVNEVVLLLALKRNQEALDKADELPEELALTYYLRAVASNRLDKLIEAFANLKKAFTIDPALKDIARIDGDVTDLMQQMEDEKKEKEEQAKEKAKEKENVTDKETTEDTNEGTDNEEAGDAKQE